MKNPLLLISLLAILAAGAFAQSGRRVSTPRTAPSAPIQAPLTPEPELPVPVSAVDRGYLPEALRERQIRTIDNSTFRLSDFQGKVVVINLWASWCGPCRQEVPEYERVRKSYAGRDVEFIGLTTEDQNSASDRVKKFLREVNFGFRLGWADRDVARTLMNGKGAIPQTLVLDANGHIVNHWTGFAPRQSGERLKQAIEEAYSRTPSLKD
jgi:thiol-disulfide isomerase/thioredoxin